MRGRGGVGADVVAIARRLAGAVDALAFAAPVAHVYNPLDYARAPAEAMHYARSTVARALIVTSITLTAGFLVLATSDFNLNVTSGVMIAIVVSSAVIYDLLMLPGLVVWLDEKLGARTASAIEANSSH